jgi:hypothetical protein
MVLPIVGSTVTSEKYGPGIVLRVYGPAYTLDPDGKVLVKFDSGIEQCVSICGLILTQTDEELQIYSLGQKPLHNGY